MGDLHRFRRPAGDAVNWRAAKTSAALCGLFLLVYGTSNWLTSFRHNVGSFYFAWERHIPFVPLTILPYMSIDLFFIAAPFVCRDERELRTLTRRIVAAILTCGAFFLLMPLRFAFERPHVDGPLGIIFNNFRLLDRPYNQFPSLHIALGAILAVLYLQHTHGLLRFTLGIWFGLIGLSTLLTYQHHVIDVIGGFALGVLCVYLWQDEPLRQPVTCNLWVGMMYAAGAAVWLAVAILTRPWGLLLIWPVISLSLVAAAYFGLGPGIFRKRQGRVPILSSIVLWPVLAGQRLSLAYYKTKSNAWDALTDHLWIGRKLSTPEARRAVAQGVGAVLDLSGEFSEAPPFTSVEYCQLSVMDLTAPTMDQLAQALDFIRSHIESGIVYVHCKAGYSRTAAVAGAYLLSCGRAQSADEAVQMLRDCRRGIVLRPEALAAIRDYDRRAHEPALATGAA
ncbi:MAG TPA: dual specificity protein phosphatase family protein [Tepidisphaeraceae bacterium]|nr:dual specificity protein phosphatase family protein [Tepidisphaeraceae bacterium]